MLTRCLVEFVYLFVSCLFVCLVICLCVVLTFACLFPSLKSDTRHARMMLVCVRFYPCLYVCCLHTFLSHFFVAFLALSVYFVYFVILDHKKVVDT